ncbi:MAG: sensor histidine kinase, partial [Acidimicrobiales bacterium]
MRRRILAAMLATVALSLVLAGTGTYLLLRRQATQTTESGLRREAEGIVGLIALAPNTRVGAIRQTRVVEGLRLQDISLLSVGAGGVIRGDLPNGFTAADIDTQALLGGQTLSGRKGPVLWAAASIVRPRGAIVAVLTREPEAPRVPVGWFLLAGGIALAVGTAVAAGLSESLTRPLRQAQDATVRIAAGDLSEPLPEPSPTADDEVAGLTRAINAMAGSLAHARGLERRFLLSVSHDLRTPLTSSRGYAEAIAGGTALDPVAAARIVGTESQRLDRLVRDLLDLARLDAHEFSFDLRTVDIAEVVADTALGFRPAADSAGVGLHVTGPVGGVAWALVDPDPLAQAVANLVENALKYATANVWVDLRSRVPEPSPGTPPTVGSFGGTDDADTRWLVGVADDGPGIA